MERKERGRRIYGLDDTSVKGYGREVYITSAYGNFDTRGITEIDSTAIFSRDIRKAMRIFQHNCWQLAIYATD